MCIAAAEVIANLHMVCIGQATFKRRSDDTTVEMDWATVKAEDKTLIHQASVHHRC